MLKNTGFHRITYEETIWLLLYLMKLSAIPGHSKSALLPGCGQLLLAIGADPKGISGKLLRFEKSGSAWDQMGEATPCVFGKNGWAMGMELPALNHALPAKTEGDQCTPAGIFSLGTAYGYAPKVEVDFTAMPYLAVNEHIKAVDDPGSRYYNQIVDERLIDNKDWNSAEDMRRKDDLYKWGIVINYNTSNIDPQAGSCIYMHLWRNKHTGTAGCTAMAEEDFLAILKWLVPGESPCILQVPENYLQAFLTAHGIQFRE